VLIGRTSYSLNLTLALISTSGVGYAICCRLIDEFLTTRPSTQSLSLIITTRSPSKSIATITSLTKHITRNPLIKSLSQNRISLQSEHFDLCRLLTIRSGATRLLASLPRLDVLFLNAGTTGSWTISWPHAIWQCITDPIEAVTYPNYTAGEIGTLLPPQLPNSKDDPPLGEIFCANVFGHYLLTHYLTPLLQASPNPRIIPVSSLEAQRSAFSLADIQCLQTSHSYLASKRLIDILALTASLPATKTHVDTYFTTDKHDPSTPPIPYNTSTPRKPNPRFYLTHPGICDTTIVALHWIMLYLKLFSMYFARLLGSPWHDIQPYKGATAPVWLALTAQSTLDTLEKRDGVGKWGSATDLWGRERVLRTEVQGWGFGGTVGMEGRFGKKGRRRGAADLTAKEREVFEEEGMEAWRQMEELRVEWEKRLDG
jgi:3-keto steroid reductase